MTKLNNSNELLELIKLSATKLYNWRGEEKLVVRLGFGVMREEDTLLTMSDVNEYGAMTDTDIVYRTSFIKYRFNAIPPEFRFLQALLLLEARLSL